MYQQRTIRPWHTRTLPRSVAAILVTVLCIGSLSWSVSRSYATAGDTDGTTPPTPFTCQPFFYQFSDGYLYRFNSATGSYDDTDLDDAGGDDGNKYMDDVPRLDGANGVGYNPADNFIYAVDTAKEIYRVGVDGWVSLGVPAGSDEVEVQRTAGDFIDDDVLLTAAGGDFSKITISGDSVRVDSYTTTGDKWEPADFTVDSDGTYAFGVKGTTLYRLTIATGDVETQPLTMTGNNGGNGWGSAYSTQDGELFFYQNTNSGSDGQIWMMEAADVDSFVDGGSALPAEQIAEGQSLSTPNDGASCPTASSPFAAPIVVDDAYAFTTGTTFSADAEELGLLAGDSASSTGAVLYKVGLTSDLSTSTANRLPLDTARTDATAATATNSGADNQVSNGTQTLTVTDWDSGEFEVTGLSGSFTFYYQVVEETKLASYTSEQARRTSNIGTVTIASLTVDANAGGSGNTVLPSAVRNTAYSPSHTFEATSGREGSIFWHAEFIVDGSGDTLPAAPVNTASLPPGMSLEQSTGVLTGTPTGGSGDADVDYTIRVYASLDRQFKSPATRDFSFTVLAAAQSGDSGGGGGGSGGGNPSTPAATETGASDTPVSAPRARQPVNPAPSLQPADELPSAPPESATRVAPPVAPPTLDAGSGVTSGGTTTRAAISSASAQRSLSEVSSERLGGFLSYAPVTIEVRGAKTAARFVTDEEILNNPSLLVQQVAFSSESSLDTFFSVERVSLHDAPTRSREPLPEEEEVIAELFESAGLSAPLAMADKQLEALGSSGWIAVDSSVRGYKPGSVVYLVANSEPLVVGHAIVGEDGTAEVHGDVPVKWFGLGEHRLRAVGVKQFEGIQVDAAGELVIPEPVIEQIRGFDLGTQATVLASGANPEGSEHLAIRVIPLEPDAPWWTLWILALTFALIVLARLRGVLVTRGQVAVGVLAVLLAAVPGVVLGWISTVTVVAVWALGLGLLAAIAVSVIPALDRRRGRVRD